MNEHNPYVRKNKKDYPISDKLYERAFSDDFFGNIGAWLKFHVHFCLRDQKIKIKQNGEIVVASGMKANNLALKYLYEQTGAQSDEDKINVLCRVYHTITGEEFSYPKPINNSMKRLLLETDCKPALGRGKLVKKLTQDADKKEKKSILSRHTQ